MGARPLKKKEEGWSYGEEGHAHLPRHELPAEHLHSVDIPSYADSPAWDEPGYVDPDWHHAHLPDGAPFWQGTVKPARNSPRGEERPLSPGLVARITRRYYPKEAQLTVESEMDPNWQRRSREKERNLFSRLRASIWPG